MSKAARILEVEALRTALDLGGAPAYAVDGIDFAIDEGESVALVGESGCGKSMTALSLLRLVPSPPASIVGGSVRFDGRDLASLSESEMRRVRGNDIAMIFQEPMTSLNPVLTVGFQICEALRLHRGLGKREAWDEAVRMLELVEIPDAAGRASSYPHQLSGGMRQRVMIAMALSCNPRLLIADEPTTALDVTIQAQILDLLESLRERFGMALLLITHDLGVVAQHSSRVLVMYAGRVVEEGPVAEVFRAPNHPYTRGLLRSVPRLGLRGQRLSTIAGTIPPLSDLPSGCRFRDRCELAEPDCSRIDPPLTGFGPGRRAACIVAARAGGLGGPEA